MTHRRLPIALALAAALPLAGCGINSIPTAEENAKAKWGEVENQYQRRSDLIPNLVAVVKASAKQEKSVLVEVTQARAAANQIKVTGDDLTNQAKLDALNDAQNRLTVSLQRLQEAYPELKSIPAFETLMNQIEGTENRIASARRDYIGAVQAYNTTIRTFPDAIGASVIYGSKPMATFKATTPGAATAPKVDFN
jgi:LemA protein